MKMTFEEIKEFCKVYEDFYWDVDVWTHGDDTAIRFFDKRRPLELSLSTIVGNSHWNGEIIKKQIANHCQNFAKLWHDYYVMLERKHFPELHQ